MFLQAIGQMPFRNEQISFGEFQGHLVTVDMILSKQSRQSVVCFLTMMPTAKKHKLSCRSDFGKRHQALIFLVP